MSDTFLKKTWEKYGHWNKKHDGNTVKNVSSPVNGHDAANKPYVDENAGIWRNGDTLSGYLDMNNFRLIALPISKPEKDSHAVSWLHAVQLARSRIKNELCE